jgi:hypothetical protein
MDSSKPISKTFCNLVMLKKEKNISKLIKYNPLRYEEVLIK